MKKQEESKLSDINKAAEVLKKGGIVIFPTDTVYGIGCKINNPAGEARIRKIKNSHQKFPVLINNIKDLHKLAKVTNTEQNLINRYWPGPLTILFETKLGREKIGIRMPKQQEISELISKVGMPLFATSANFHGQPTPKSIEDLDQAFTKLADFVLPGECEEKMESTIIDATVVPHKIIRYGAVQIYGTGN